LDQGITIDKITSGLERVYAITEEVHWTLDREPNKLYLPETDSFDTWFSSGQWSTIVFGDFGSKDLNYFYPSHSIVLGHDLLRLSVSREIVLGWYLMGKLPFKIVYTHRLLKGQDGRKMSKSLGNAVPLEFYIDTYGADVTRMALVSYTAEQDDFILTEDRLAFFSTFASRLWEMGRLTDLANQYEVRPFRFDEISLQEKNVITEVENLSKNINFSLDRYLFANAEDKLCEFLFSLEKYAEYVRGESNFTVPLSVFKYVYKKYITVLHPFTPFITEELNTNLYKGESLVKTK
jgi:valyl-tRNA synthetase